MDGHPIYDHWKPIFTFFIGTGVRVGELSSLRWKDVIFENGYIIIDHAVIYFAGKLNKTNKRIYVSTPKTEAGIRKIPMVSEVRKALDEVKQYQYDNGIFCKSDIDGYTDFIFLNRFGTVYLQHKREALRLPHFTCHSLRHTFCARFCEHETNLKVIQSVMGHVDIGTTMNIFAEDDDSEIYTDPVQAKDFVARTGVDALAWRCRNGQQS